MEEPHFSYNIFHGNTTRELTTQIQSTLKVPESLPKSKGFLKTETGKKPLCDVGNTLANVKKIIKSVPEACKSSETRSISSVSELKGLPDISCQMDEVFSDEADLWNCEHSKMINFDQSLDPVPKPGEDNYEDIVPSDKDISMATIRKMVYLWEQYDIPHQSLWQFDEVDKILPLPESPQEAFTEHLMSKHMQELPVPEAIPLIPLASF